MIRSVRLPAQAKVNLTLEVLGRRPDGYHELRSVFALVDLADRVRVGPARALDVRVRPDPGAAPGAELALRAVRALAAQAGRPALVHVRVAKRIPVAAGLGGGSSDAGAVLRGLARLWRLGPIDLSTVAAGLGSDVPFFVGGSPFALVSGRGEVVAPLPGPAAPLWIVLVRVPARVATAEVFAALRPDERSDGRRSAALAAAFAAGRIDPDTVRAQLGNDLTAAAARVCREIGEARFLAGARGVSLTLSGSGPSLFTPADGRADALRIARLLRAAGLDARPRRLGSLVRRGDPASALPLRSSHGRER